MVSVKLLDTGCEGDLGATSSPHWSRGLIRPTWLARRWVSPSSLTAPCASLPKLSARSKTTIPVRGGPVFGQGYTSSCAPRLEPPNKLSNSLIPPLLLLKINKSHLMQTSFPTGSMKLLPCIPPILLFLLLMEMVSLFYIRYPLTAILWMPSHSDASSTDCYFSFLCLQPFPLYRFA